MLLVTLGLLFGLITLACCLVLSVIDARREHNDSGHPSDCVLLEGEQPDRCAEEEFGTEHVG
jgi:hypothetical protein